MHANKVTVERLYHAFAHLDGVTMAGCYAPDAQFEDEVFLLHGQAEIGGMWRMLCGSVRAGGGGADWKLNWRVDAIDTSTGRASWEAHYRFANGRPVDNRIDAAFRFDGAGRITHHRDHFDFWRWSRQALGAPGLLLGWSPLLRRQVRARAHRRLQNFLARGS